VVVAEVMLLLVQLLLIVVANSSHRVICHWPLVEASIASSQLINKRRP